jgi:hypothetical protein
LLTNITKDYEFSVLMKNHILDLLAYLFDKGQTFGLLCKIDEVSFNPELPEEMQNNFAHLTLFFLAGYTYESAYVDSEYITFEAGFGSENFGSVVTVPLLAIMHIIVDETPIFINLADTPSTFPQELEQPQNEIDEKSVENSMSVFLSNPENQKFFKK